MTGPGAGIVPGQRISRSIYCKVCWNFLIIDSTASSSDCKNSFGKTIGAPKRDSAGERPVSSLG
jgi:hypothetical protein